MILRNLDKTDNILGDIDDIINIKNPIGIVSIFFFFFLNISLMKSNYLNHVMLKIWLCFFQNQKKKNKNIWKKNKEESDFGSYYDY